MSAADDLLLSTRELAELVRDVTYLARGVEDNAPQSGLISLGSDIVYAILAAEKNGVAIAPPAGYTWVKYRPNVQIVGAIAANDMFFFRIATGLSDASIQEHLDKARKEAFGALRSYYDADADIDLSPDFLEIVRDLAAGRIIQIRCRGVALDSAQYRSGNQLEMQALNRIQEVRRGVAELADANGDAIPRKDGALVAGVLSTSGAIATRADWWTRLQAYDSGTLIPIGQGSG